MICISLFCGLWSQHALHSVIFTIHDSICSILDFLFLPPTHAGRWAGGAVIVWPDYFYYCYIDTHTRTHTHTHAHTLAFVLIQTHANKLCPIVCGFWLSVITVFLCKWKHARTWRTSCSREVTCDWWRLMEMPAGGHCRNTDRLSANRKLSLWWFWAFLLYFDRTGERQRKGRGERDGMTCGRGTCFLKFCFS